MIFALHKIGLERLVVQLYQLKLQNHLWIMTIFGLDDTWIVGFAIDKLKTNASLI